MKTIISYQARQAIEVGRKNHWRFKVIDQDGIPQEPVYKSGWWFETLPEAPVIASSRLLALKTAGIKVKGIMIAHEAPKLLGAPKTETKPKPDFRITDSTSIPNALPLVEAVISVLVFVVPIVFELFFQMILIDPAIVVVLEDGTWLEVCNYYD